MKLKNILLYLLPIAGLCSSCNDEWENEQFTHYISFKAPINSDGVSRINVRYRSGNEKTTFQLPIIVSGSTTNERNITVHVGLDTDTLKVLNQERFNNRTDLYYQVLPKKILLSFRNGADQCRARCSINAYRLFNGGHRLIRQMGITIDYRRIT